ncbi:MAG: hypothetical protein J3Q66DRAFT_439937 [Benniella sp.]|nr:MAG: hypothetical protein J3Q66DRAFT_439937 [Benniella sp.]
MKHLILQESLAANPGILINHYISHVYLPKRGVAALLLDGHIVQDVLAPNDHIYADTAIRPAGGNGGGAGGAPPPPAPPAPPPPAPPAPPALPAPFPPAAPPFPAPPAGGAPPPLPAPPAGGAPPPAAPPAPPALPAPPAGGRLLINPAYVLRPPRLVSADELMKPWKQEIALAEAMYVASNDKRQFLETWYKVWKEQELKFATEAEDAQKRMAEMSDPDIANLLASWSSFYQHESRLAAEKAGLTKLELRLMQQSQQ